MIRLVWRTDVHLSDRAPASRKDDWTESVLGKLRQTILVANKLKAQAILDGGDFFHIKSPVQNSHSLIRKVADLHKGCHCPVYANVGNHDCVYGDYSYIDQQPLGVLFSTGVFERCYDEHEAVFEQDGVKVRVVGVPYHGTKYEMERFDRITKGDEDYLVVIAHVLASNTGGHMFENEDIIAYDDLMDHPADVFCFGHWHKNQGVERSKDGSKTFVNIGSLTRGALTQDSMHRNPCIAVLEFTPEGVGVKVVNLKVEPAEDVFDAEKRAQVQERTNTIDKFVKSIQENLNNSNRATLEDTVRSMDLSDEVRETALSYMEKADVG